MNNAFSNLPAQGIWSSPPRAERFMHGWFDYCNKAVLNAAFQFDPKNILELGAWYGKSTEYVLTNCPGATVYSVDIWDDSLWWIQEDPELRAMVAAHPVYETFLANFWERRDRLYPLKMHSLDAISLLGAQGVEIDCIYLDSGHFYEETKKEVKAIKAHFPGAFLCGDDYTRDDCRKGLNEMSAELGCSLIVIHNAWILLDDHNKHKFMPYENYDYSKFVEPR